MPSQHHFRSALYLFSALALALGFSFAREAYNKYEIDRQIQALEHKSFELETEQKSLLALKNELSARDFLEGEARLKLGLKKPGEVVIVLPGVETAMETPENSKPSSAPEIKDPNWLQWWKYFFKRPLKQDRK